MTEQNLNEINELRGMAERVGAEDFVDVGQIIRDVVDEKWKNPTGAYNIALKERLTDLSESDDWAEAKLEWKATGNIWYVPMRDSADDILPQVHQDKHPHECICGHKIAWHFEILNTENDTLEIVGSEHIGFWMVARHLVENLNMPADMITQERIEIWVKEAVKSMKAEWWWKMHGEQFEEWFNELSEIDLRTNVRNGESYWDEDTNRYEHQHLIRKKAEGKIGEPEYAMASIVWRWNHPDNEGVFYTNNKTGVRIEKTTWKNLLHDEKYTYEDYVSEIEHPVTGYLRSRKVPLWSKSVESTAQKDTRGYPNERLWNDLQMFYLNLPRHKLALEEKDKERAERVAFVVKEREEQRERQRIQREEHARQEAIRREERRLAEEERQRRQAIRDAERARQLETAFEDFCEKHDLPEFTLENGNNQWEQNFLKDMIKRINTLHPLSPKQILYVQKIVNNIEQPAKEKQLSYIRKLGGTPNPEMTKREASDMIGELKNPTKVSVNTEEEE